MKVGMMLSGLGSTLRGAELIYQQLAQGLEAKGIDLTVYGGGSHLDGVDSYVHVPSLKRTFFQQIPKLPGRDIDYEDRLFSYAILPFLASKHFDVIFNASDYSRFSISAYRKIRNKKLKNIFTLMGYGRKVGTPKHFADVVVVFSPSDQTRFTSLGHRTELIPPGVDTSRFAPRSVTKSELGLQDAFTVFTTGVLYHGKGLPYLINAMAMVRDGYLVVAGDGPDRNLLKDMGKRLLGDRIRFLGHVSRSVLIDHYSACDVFCEPEICSFGIVIPEAMACGTPAVADDNPVQRRVVGDGGLVANVKQPEQLAETLEKFSDKDTARKAGYAARKWVVDGPSSINAMINSYSRVLESLTNGF